MWENSEPREFSAKVLQVVFLAYLTVLLLVRTVWPKIWEISCLCELSAQVTQIVFLADLTVLRIF